MKFRALAFAVGSAAACQAFAVQVNVGTSQLTDIRLSNSLLPALSQAKLIGHASPTDRIFISINLAPRHPVELEAFCNEVSNPSSPQYQQFMTPEQVGENFGATQDEVASVVKYIRGQGMSIDLVAPNRIGVLAWATVAQLERAFNTKINNYSAIDVEGKPITFRANSSALTIPGSMSAVTFIEGVSNYYRPKPMVGSTLTPPLVRGLYNIAPAYASNFRGQGRRIGYSNWDGWKIQYAINYINQFALPVPAGGAGSNIHPVNAGAVLQGTNGAGEADLDLQMELAMAPLADIYVYDGSTLTGVLNKEATDNFDIISESWGWSGGTGAFNSAHNIHLTMTAQGMTYMCASGDNGAAGANGTYYYPGNDPEVLGVGGTIATVDGNSGARITETGWSGSGGGWKENTDTFNHKPTWQVGNGVLNGIDKRLQPDIAGHSAASNGAYVVFSGPPDGWYGFNGTSCASPDAAGALAIVEQRLAAIGKNSRLGRIQDVVYAMNGRPDVWFDILSGSNGTLPNGAASNCTPAWDSVTGWGAPNWDGFFAVVAKTEVNPTGYTAFRGAYVSGNTASLVTSDDNYLVLRKGIVLSSFENPVDVYIAGSSGLTSANYVKLHVETHADTVGLTQWLYLFNYATNAWDLMDTRACSTSDNAVDVTVASGAANYVGPGGAVQARIAVKQTGITLGTSWNLFTDQVHWTLG